MKRIVTVLRALAVSMLAVGLLAAHASAEQWVYPVGPPGGPVDLARGFDPPGQPWLAGHRGVDIRAPEGAEVRAAGGGEVTYAGMLAGRGVVVIRHGALRTTYEPVDATVSVGTPVSAGAPIGILAAAGSHCAPDTCLHWGAIEDGGYVDPLSLIASRRIRLLPLAGRTLTEEPPPEPPAGTRLGWPVGNPRVTSPYGMRVHPITGVRKLHDGTDFGAPCGTPIRAAAAGRVVAVGSQGAYGQQVTVDHGSLAGVTMTTSYSHLSRFGVRPGAVVAAGGVIGWVGTTGMSTGCHLHFMVYADGSVADPMSWLPSRT